MSIDDEKSKLQKLHSELKDIKEELNLKRKQIESQQNKVYKYCMTQGGHEYEKLFSGPRDNGEYNLLCLKCGYSM
tara:strand:+ start:1481 stop:1705 length:225 start_codon:yes stop_codon:yes gene_type:complete